MTVGTVFIASASGLHARWVNAPDVEEPGGGRDEYGPYWVPMEGNSLKGWEPILPYESARALGLSLPSDARGHIRWRHQNL
jgi:hypothetical protein